ncbi:MAG: hypothetical protein ACQETR_03420 [Thermodesulfobacteriota bacterium]
MIQKYYTSILVSLILASLLFIVACKNETNVLFPDRLKGTWITHDDQYKNRFIEIDGNLIVLGTGEGESLILFIEDFKPLSGDSSQKWLFECKDISGTTFDMTFFFNEGPEENSLMLKNMTHITWVKANEN